MSGINHHVGAIQQIEVFVIIVQRIYTHSIMLLPHSESFRWGDHALPSLYESQRVGRREERSCTFPERLLIVPSSCLCDS